jgi:hypothetical protein
MESACLSLTAPPLTPAKLAANQANGKQSHGPATQEGIERIRAANTRHGFYSKAPGSEMRLLGGICGSSGLSPRYR